MARLCVSEQKATGGDEYSAEWCWGRRVEWRQGGGVMGQGRSKQGVGGRGLGVGLGSAENFTLS